MDNLEIDLVFNPDHFREIYYKKGSGTIFTSSPVKDLIKIILLFIFISIIIYISSLRFPKISGLFFIFSIISLILIIILIVNTSIAVFQHKQLKKNVENYLKWLGSYKSYKLNLTSASIEVVLDSDIKAETWDQIKLLRIENGGISLFNEKGLAYIFPAKSMKPAEFEDLKDFLRAKIKYLR